VGIGLADDAFGWYANPYVEIGAEWGPCFYAGFKVKSNGGDNDAEWSLPIGIIVSF
jgi:hypothetical protein